VLVEPAFTDTRMPPRSAEYRALWDSSTSGFSGRDAYNAFRRALEAPAPALGAAA